VDALSCYRIDNVSTQCAAVLDVWQYRK